MAKKDNTNNELSVFSTQDINKLEECSRNIIEAQMKSDGLAETIAANLYIIHRKKLYEIDDFKNIYDYAKERFDISRGTVSDSIGVFERFGNKEAYKIEGKYAEYNFSTLMRMKKLSDEEIEKCGIGPTMSRKEVIACIEKLKDEKAKENALPDFEKRWGDVYKKYTEAQPESIERIKKIEESVPDFFKKDYVRTASDYEELIKMAESEIEALTESSVVEQSESSPVELESINSDGKVMRVIEINMSDHLKNGKLNKKEILDLIWDKIEHADYITLTVEQPIAQENTAD